MTRQTVWAEARDRLLADQGGEAAGALWHRDVGPIDVRWGEPGTGKSDGYGLAKLAKFHPEVIDQLPQLLADMEVMKRTANRI